MGINIITNPGTVFTKIYDHSDLYHVYEACNYNSSL
jgi:hypothetical protein